MGNKFNGFSDVNLTYYKDLKLELVEVEAIKIDGAVSEILKTFNYQQFFNPKIDDDFYSENCFYIDLIQAPIITYKDGSKYLVVSGLLTYQKLCALKGGDFTEVKCLVIDKKPALHERKLLILNEISKTVLRLSLNEKTTNLFEKLSFLFLDHGSDTIFESASWQALYPQIKNKKQLCNWLNITNKKLGSN